MAVQEGVNKVGACMKSIVPERPPKETARRAEALRADEEVACATLAMKLVFPGDQP
jgi:hypothetical protein